MMILDQLFVVPPLYCLAQTLAHRSYPPFRSPVIMVLQEKPIHFKRFLSIFVSVHLVYRRYCYISDRSLLCAIIFCATGQFGR